MDTPTLLPLLPGIDAHATFLEELRDFAIFFLDVEGRVVSWKPGARVIFGYEASEIIGRNGDELFVPEDRENGVPLTQRSQAREQGRAEGVRWHQRKDGTRFWGSGAMMALRDAGGQVCGFGIIVRDVTAQKQVEDELRSSQERFEMVARATNDAVWDWQLGSDDVWWNSNVQKVFGYSPEEAQKVNWWQERIHPDDRERVIAELQAVIESGEQVWKCEHRYLRADGSIAEVFNRGYVVRNAQGEPIRVLGAVMDVTARRELESSQQIFRQLAENNPDFIGISGMDGAPIYLNPAGRRMVGLKPGETEPRRGIEEFFFPEDRDFVFNEFTLRAQREGQATTEIRFRHFETGQTVWMNYLIFVLRDEAGNPIAMATVSRDISVRKELEEKQQIFRQLADNSPDFMAMCDLSFKPLYGNPKVRQLLGVRNAEMAKNPRVEDYFFPEDVPFVMGEFFPRVIREGQGIIEVRLRHLQTGQAVWMSYQLFVLRDTQGQPVALATISRDISARKAMEAALRKSEERYRTLFEAIDTGFCVIEVLFDDAKNAVDYRFLEINPAFETQTGLQNAVGQRMREMVPDIDDFWPQTYGRVALTGEPIHVENSADAMNRFFEVYAFRVGTPQEHQVAVLFTDTTARKRGEIEREKLVSQLEFERERLNAIFQNAPAFVAILRGPDQVFELVNPAYSQLVGHRDVVGKPLLEAIPEIAGQGFIEMVEGILKTGQPLQISEAPVMLQREPGSALEERIVNLLYQPLTEPDGTISGVFAHGVDITEQVRARKAAEEANRVKDEFLATLSHELRTPLTAIMGWANILRSGNLGESEAQRGLATIERNARAQSQLIEDILDVSRVITGKMRLEVQPVDLASVIDEAVATVTPAAVAKEIRLQRVLDVGASVVSGDPARLGQIVWNLLSNAIKFTPKGGRVQIRLERVNSHVEIAIVDNGAGISPAVLPHVFERFRQADSTSTRVYGGLGLGLAIVRHLVELHGGSVEAHSEGVGRGAEFVVKLPLVAIRSLERRTGDQESRVHPTSGARTSTEITPRLEGLHVLVVDDQDDTRDLLSLVLQGCGARVTLASRASEAFEQLQNLRPDVLVSDIGMPGEDGFSLIKRVRALPRELGAQTPAAALTAFARVEDRVKILRAGFQIHLPKPVEPMELATVVATLAGRRGED